MNIKQHYQPWESVQAIGQIIKHRQSPNIYYMIVVARPEFVNLMDYFKQTHGKASNMTLTYKELMDDWLTKDGSVCGNIITTTME